MVRVLASEFKADVNAPSYDAETPLHRAVSKGDLSMIRVLIAEFKAEVNIQARGVGTPLHLAAMHGHLEIVRVLISEFNAYVNERYGFGVTPLHVAACHDNVDVIRVLISEFKADIRPHANGEPLLHTAIRRGHLNVVRVLVSEFNVAIDDRYPTAFQFVLEQGTEEVALALMNEFHCATHISHIFKVCRNGWVDLVRALVKKHGTGVLNDKHDGKTPFDKAVEGYDSEKVAVALISEFHCDTKGGTPYIHTACRKGWAALVRALVKKHGTGILKDEYASKTPFDVAIQSYHSGGEEVALVLMNEFHCDTKGGTPYIRTACKDGWVNLVRALVRKHGTGILIDIDRCGGTLFDAAVDNDREELAVTLINEFHCDTKGGKPYIYTACKKGWVNLIRALVQKHGTGILKGVDKYGHTPLDMAVNSYGGKEEAALVLMNEFQCGINLKGIREACEMGWVNLVRALIYKRGTDIMNFDVFFPSHMYGAETRNRHVHEVAVMLCKEFGSFGRALLRSACSKGAVNLVQSLILDADVTARDSSGNTPLHVAARGGRVEVVRTLILDGNADVTARDNTGNTPLHVAAEGGKKDVVNILIFEFSCDVNVPGRLGRSLLHSACASNNGSLVKLVGQHVSPWVVDDNGDTPLHICARREESSVQALLQLDPPVMIRNNLRQTPKDLEDQRKTQSNRFYGYIDAYMKKNKGKIHSQYKVVQKHAKKKYSLPEPITGAFVVGNPGAGKSSFVEALKREGFLDSFKRVSESSVPPHTAGIVPSIHTSKHYGRVLFYDFAGDAEYYSSHAAILENLASSRKGDNIFVLVIDMREEMVQIKKTYRYWLSFIRHQQFHGQKPRLIVVGSHLDLLAGDEAKARGREFKIFSDSINTEAVQLSALFMLDCCKPKSKQISNIHSHMNKLTKDSPRFKLSPQASTLLGLIEKDFSNVPACFIQALLSHIEETGIQLIGKAQSLHPILLELHDLGLLFLIDSSNRESSSVVLNMPQLTNIVHKSLFSEEAILKASFVEEGLSFLFSVGIVPQNILAKILPKNVTKECLVQLQYCQEIGHAEAHVFPSLKKVSDSTDQSFLFFPALCSTDKGEVMWVTPPHLSYGIGWLARCTDPCDYLSPRFLHVLMLRLVFKFTLSAHPPADQVSSGSPDLGHFQRRCTVWKAGVHWLMEEGVECMVELAGANREVVVLTKSTKDRAENCATVFNDIVSCVMEAKAEFCHSVRLEFFLLDSTSEADYLSADNLFAMRDVERVLTSAEGRAEVIVSASGKRQMERSKLLCLRNFTLWSSLFPMDFKSVLHYIKDIVRELYTLGLHLDIPRGVLDSIEAAIDVHCVTDKERRGLVKGWMSSSLDPPCWWHLVEALHAAERGTLAQKIAKDFGK